MRAGWWALVVGLLVGGGLVVVATAPRDDGLGPVVRALDLDRGAGLEARRAAAVSAAAARCLAALGIGRSVPADPPPVIPDAELDPVAWAERWGFGITTAGAWAEPPNGLEAGPPMDPQERRCRDEAADDVYGLRERLLAPLRPSLTTLGQVIDADPASQAADAAWTTCLAVASIEIEPITSAPDRLDAIRAWFGARTGPSPDPSVVALEQRVAAAVAHCDLARAAGRRAAADPHERAFVRAHAAELARIGAALRAAEAAYPSPAP